MFSDLNEPAINASIAAFGSSGLNRLHLNSESFIYEWTSWYALINKNAIQSKYGFMESRLDHCILLVII